MTDSLMNLVSSDSDTRTPRLPIRTVRNWFERVSWYSLLLETARREQTSLMVNSFMAFCSRESVDVSPAVPMSFQ